MHNLSSKRPPGKWKQKDSHVLSHGSLQNGQLNARVKNYAEGAASVDAGEAVPALDFFLVANS